MDTLELPGCFGMTELGHGSNVMGIETTATYDAAAGQFVLHTPTNEASKMWIGGAAASAKVCCIFAQLTVAGKWEGPHVFVVRLRDDAGNPMPGEEGWGWGCEGEGDGSIPSSPCVVGRAAALPKRWLLPISGNQAR